MTIGGKPCLNANWEASHPDTGRPYLQCNPALDVAGAKDLKLYVALTEHLYGVTSDLEYNTSTSFSICMAGKTNIRTGITKKYYGRPCNVQGSNVPNVSFSNRAPCVSEKSGKGELCLECPDGALCYIPGEPWKENIGKKFTYFDPTSKEG